MAGNKFPVAYFRLLQVLALSLFFYCPVCLGRTTPRPLGCEQNGKFYRRAQEIFRSQVGDWCYGTACSPTGVIVRWDNFNCGATVQQSGCVVDGISYERGNDIFRKQAGSWCYGKFCALSGRLIVWNNYDCAEETTTRPPTHPTSPTKKSFFLEQAGEVTPPPATPTHQPATQTTLAQPPQTTTARSVCVYNGVTYQPGDQIPDGRGCGFECAPNGELLAYPCQPPTTPPITAPTSRLLGSTTDSTTRMSSSIIRSTVPVRPSTTPPPACFYNGQFYPPGQVIFQDAQGCGAYCNADAEIVQTTCGTGPTTSPYPTTPRGCFYNGQFYPPNQIISIDAFGCGAICSAQGQVIQSTCTTPTPPTSVPTPTPVSVCLFNGVTYQPGQRIPMQSGCGFECGPNGEVQAYPCTTSTRSSQPITYPLTTPTTPRGQCEHDGRVYAPGERFGEGKQGSWCYGMICEDGQILSWDNFLCDGTTTSPTTIPTTPSRGCEHDGRVYAPGERFGEGKQGSWCYGMICGEDGQVTAWDNFQCDGSTTRPTTIPTSPPRGCEYEGRTYGPGDRFGEGRQGTWCYGKICGEDGQIIPWDNFQCYDTTTTSSTRTMRPSTTTTTTPQQGVCTVNGKVYTIGEEITRVSTSNMCYGTLCDENGDVISWEDFTCGQTIGNTVAPNEPVKDCDYQGQKYKPGQKILLADSRGCTVYCSLEGRVRVERFPCVTLVSVTTTRTDSPENSTLTGNSTMCSSTNGTHFLCSGTSRTVSGLLMYTAMPAFLVWFMFVTVHTCRL